MIRAVIIDDEQHGIDWIKELLVPFREKIKCVGSARTLQNALSLIKEVSPDLVFLDIQIDDRTGFEFLQMVSPISFEVIFTTAHEKYAVRAFKFSAVDYLLKPIDADDLRIALLKFETKSASKHLEQKIDVLLHNLEARHTVKKITVPTMDGYEFLEVTDIVRCRSDVNYTDIHLKNGKKITVSKTLKSFEELLEPEHFFRIHNSHLINLREVKKYVKGKGGYVTMNDNTHLEVSTRRKDAFLKRLI
ncbi:LytR/AlgR family response regulator transcription factor [Pricia sp.]|uniref:LytR/AlgR family response regulator transcription factor n=1 Tax=Pricia sp. TaxID=2268138 RepID=UPI003594940F